MSTPSTDAGEPLLTPTQKRLVGFALGVLALLGTIWMLAVALGKIGELLGKFYGVIWPLAAAGILALMLQPVVHLLETKGKMKRLWAVLLLYSAFVLVLAGLALAITPTVVEQVLDFIAFIPQFWQNALNYVQNHYPEWVALAERRMANPTIKNMVEGALNEAQHVLKQMLPSLKSAGVGILNVFGFLTNLAVLPIYLFFFLLSGRTDPTRDLGEHLTFLPDDKRDDVVFLAREFVNIVVSFFRGQLLIGLIMGVLLAIGFTVVGLKFGLLIGLMLGVLNIVPYLGTIIGLCIALPLAFLQPGGGWSLVIWVSVVFVIVQNIEGWFLTPKIMGERTGLHPVMVIVSIFFWGAALNGILGMILAIPLTAFFVTAWRLAKRKYFTAIPGSSASKGAA